MYEIDWEQRKQGINPALDFDSDTAYLSQYLHATKKVKKKEGEVDQAIFIPFLITSDRRKWGIEKETMDNLPFHFESVPQYLRNRQWSEDKIKSFIDRTELQVLFPDVFDKVKGNLEHYLDLPNPAMYDYLSCWVIATYFHPMFNTFPELYLNAIKRSGKTKTLEAIALMAFNGKLFMNPSDATIFRLSQTNRCTILLDEVRRLRSQTEGNLRDLIRGRYKKGISVPRADENNSYAIKDYELYGPLAMANIKGLEDDMIDRTHWLTLRRTTGEKGNRDIDYSSRRWVETRDDLYLLTLTRFKDVQQAKVAFERVVDSGRDILSYEKNIINKEEYTSCTEFLLSSGISIYHPHLSTSLTNRALELAKPILVVATLISQEVSENVFQFIADLNSIQEMEESADSLEVKLMQTLMRIIGVRGEVGRDLTEVEAKIIFTELVDNFYSEVPEWLNPIKLGNTMKSMGAYAEKKTIHGRTRYVLSETELRKIAASLKIEWQEHHPLIEQEINMEGSDAE